MTSRLRKPWREAATLIIAAKSHKISTNGFDYRILCMKRSEKTSFLNNHICYPGGSTEEQDQASGWIEHFHKHGINLRDLNKLTLDYHRQKRGNALIFHDNDDSGQGQLLSKAISLRIGAIREAFEELGVLLCRSTASTSRKSSNFLRTNDILKFQQQVHDHEMTFLQLCQQLNVVPDVFSLFEWSCWLTPTTFPSRRFLTAFFLCTINEQLPIFPEPKEAFSYFWRTPEEYIQLLHQNEVWYHPPQYYEFCRLANFKEIEELQNFLVTREEQGSVLMMPIVTKCEDGMCFIFPGDEKYPKMPKLIAENTEAERFEGNLEEFREKSRILNRFEIKSPSEVELHSNCDPINGHKRPITTFDFLEKAGEDNLRTKL
ncbi:acyl-coenzyme A diphosphatase NUDT19-like [Culicoides brevitarsis]|uniref:acyl-coenzyme A diphosphatase NUDT19-like n=1 Tax=Culicoides brevitarsis TaxID=469753 RepID=UPI00307B470F